jgi:alpha-methylacyl-CoA racemase
VKPPASGPLSGVKVVEFGGYGPAPFCGMLLSDLGADVVRIDRKDAEERTRFEIVARGRRSVAVDLKTPEGKQTCLQLMGKAQLLIEPFRPGVMERLGLGPDDAFSVNSQLVYGRMTGWGQYGPLADRAGHDINYTAITGALHSLGRRDSPPTPALSLIGNMGGGGMYLAVGLLAALRHAERTGEGQVVDVAISDCVSHMMAWYHWFYQEGRWSLERESNINDGASPWFAVYQCSDGKYLSIGCIEDKFYGILLDKLGLDNPMLWDRWDPEKWPALRDQFAAIFITRPLADWEALLGDSDACYAPVLRLDEVASHPHNLAREAMVTIGDVCQPAPAPRFSKTPGAIQNPPPPIGHDDSSALEDWGIITS